MPNTLQLCRSMNAQLKTKRFTYALLHKMFLPFNDNYIKSAMFFSFEKQNTIQSQSPNSRGQFLTKYYKQHSREEKDKKINNLRQIYTSQVINWQQPYSSFLQTLTLNHNYYSLLLTLFEITEDPLWRNRINHICALIQTLHNSCFEKNGAYLSEITMIANYQNRLCRLFYLKNNILQQHFKLLIILYLNYNAKMQILDTNAISLGLLHAGKHRSDGKLHEYLWIVSQLKSNKEVISSILKITGQLIENSPNVSVQYKSSCILPVMTIISNYIYDQKEPFILDQLIENKQFQILFMYGLKDINHPQVSRQALLLCNNLLSKSKQLSFKLIASTPVMLAASLIPCEQQPIFQSLLQLRGSE